MELRVSGSWGNIGPGALTGPGTPEGGDKIKTRTLLPAVGFIPRELESAGIRAGRHTGSGKGRLTWLEVKATIGPGLPPAA